MPNVKNVSWQDIDHAVTRVVADAMHMPWHPDSGARHTSIMLVYGVPRGGLIPAALVVGKLQGMKLPVMLTDEPEHAHLIIDDLVDSGATHDRYRELYPSAKFMALFTKVDKSEWLSFPWERAVSSSGVEDNVLRIIQHIGEDPERDGLKDTPKRVVKSLAELYAGYGMKLADIITTFDQPCDEMVALRGIEFYSTCEHHMLPFFGVAHIGYIPKNGKVVGISKLARVLDMYARRLQNQERICRDVTAALVEALEPIGVGCVIEGQHMCMMCRGVQKQSAIMVTSSMLGAFRTDDKARSEFLQFIKG